MVEEKKVLNELYDEARKIVDRTGWGGEVLREEINGPVPDDDWFLVYCQALLTTIFIENGEEDPRVKINNPKITPDMVSWYRRASELESMVWGEDDFA